MSVCEEPFDSDTEFCSIYPKERFMYTHFVVSRENEWTRFDISPVASFDGGTLGTFEHYFVLPENGNVVVGEWGHFSMNAENPNGPRYDLVAFRVRS
jgi:hypothetical protein